MKGKYKDAIGHLTTLVSNNQTSDAFALLGLLEVKMGKIDEGLVHLRKAIDLDPSNSDLVVLEALALQQHKSNYAKSLECYKKAFDLIKKRRGQAAVPYELYANAGVLCHETKLYDEARQMYRSAIDALEGIDQAKQPALENVGVDGVRIAHADNGYFFGYVASGVRAIVVGTTEIKLVDDPPPVTALPFAVGDTLQLGDSFFTTEVDSITDKDGVIFVTITTPYDPMVENNNQMADDSIEIIELRVQRENKVLDMPEATTIAFNIARLHEASGNVLAAIELHKAIAKRNPTYVNSYLRLACIAVDCGALNECAQWLKIAAATAPNNSEVLTLIGNLHLSLCDWKPAQKVFEGLMNSKNAESVTAYALLRYVPTI
jgi:tetratricopeptide (TPR) repeat protein